MCSKNIWNFLFFYLLDNAPHTIYFGALPKQDAFILHYFFLSGMLETMNDYNKVSQQRTVENEVPERESKYTNVILKYFSGI